MLKIVGIEENGDIADEVVLINDEDKPTLMLIGLAMAELAFDVALACLLAKTVFRKK